MFKQFQDSIASGDLQSIVSSTIGQILIAVIAVIILILVVSIGSKSKSMKTKELVYSAIAIAIAVVLSQIKIVKFPQGGSITLASMLFIVVIGYWFGVTQGVICGIAYGLLQLIVDGWVVHPIQLIIDYPLAFGALGLAGIFRKSESGLLKGLVFGAFARFICHFISGVVFFSQYAADYNMDPVPYSLGYNIAYIGAEVFVTGLVLSIPAVDFAMKQIKRSATS